MLVPKCPGAKLSVFTMLVQNCLFSYPGAKLSGAKLSYHPKLSVFTILVPNCPFAKLSGAKLSDAKLPYHQVNIKTEFLAWQCNC